MFERDFFTNFAIGKNFDFSYSSVFTLNEHVF